MKYRVAAGVLTAALFVLGWSRTISLEPVHEKGLLPTNPPTPYIHYISRTEPHRRALVVHGLDSNKEFMQIFSSALADDGVEVYAIDLPGHGDSSAGFNGVLATHVLEQAVSYLKPDIAVGHSMGASLLIELAHDVKFQNLILISPAPTQVNALKFQHALVTTEGWDFPAVNTFAPQLEGVDLRKFQWGMHSSALVNPAQIREIVIWLGGNPGRLHTVARLAWLGMMFATAIAFAFVLLPSRPPAAVTPRPFSETEILLGFVVAGAIALIVQRFVSVFGWIRLYATDYLITFFFVAGLLLLLFAGTFRKFPVGAVREAPARQRAALSYDRAGFLKAIGMAAYVILVLGLLTGSHLIHMTLSHGRWWRFVVISAGSFPLFLFDELAIRDVHPWRNAGIGIATRALLIAWIATGVLLFNRQSAFLVLLLGLILLFWVALWFLTCLVRRNVQNPAATALFAALVQGWMFAAWFVTV
jgi:pimeloyl-ACP methyl ester carboxylesterase